MKRNYTVDFLKFIFAVIVMLYHSNSMTVFEEKYIFINGRIGVEFFFIVSGYFMCVSAERAGTYNDLGEETFNFIKHKISALMPNFIIAYFIAFIVYHFNAGISDPAVYVLHIIESLPDLFLIKNSGIKEISYNGPSWYLSAMLLSMIIIYPMIKKYNNSFYYIFAPLVFLFIMGNFYQNYGSLSNLEKWNGWILNGTLRGFTDLLGGCLCYKASMKLRSYRFSNFGKIILTIIEYFMFIISIILLYYNKSSGCDFFIFLLFMIGLTITFSF